MMGGAAGRGGEAQPCLPQGAMMQHPAAPRGNLQGSKKVRLTTAQCTEYGWGRVLSVEVEGPPPPPSPSFAHPPIPKPGLPFSHSEHGLALVSLPDRQATWPKRHSTGPIAA